MANIMTGVALARGLTDLLNDICRQEGGIRRNDPRIWQDYMHRMTLEEWQDLTATLKALHKQSPGSFMDQDLEVLQQADQALVKSELLGKSFVGRPMAALSGNKTIAWRLIMTMREVVNRYNGQYVPNRPGSVEDIRDLAPNSTFNAVFHSE